MSARSPYNLVLAIFLAALAVLYFTGLTHPSRFTAGMFCVALASFNLSAWVDGQAKR